MKRLLITIDGPAASGKSTVARLVAAAFGGFYINTGELYRALTWAAMARGIVPEDSPEAVVELLPALDLRFCLSRDRAVEVLMNGQAVPQTAIRSADVSGQVSHVARIPEVREWMIERQRETRAFGIVVMEGRDIGTVIFPDAEHKFFITASPEARARRRLLQDGENAAGATIDSVANDIRRRDDIDSRREVAPLRPADDAVSIQTDEITAEQVTEAIVKHVTRQMKESQR